MDQASFAEMIVDNEADNDEADNDYCDDDVIMTFISTIQCISVTISMNSEKYNFKG